VGDQERGGLIELAEICGRQDQLHARERAGVGGVDGYDARMRMRAPEPRSVERAGKMNIVDERSEAAQQPWIFVSSDA
jgi:hypothetical protein